MIKIELPNSYKNNCHCVCIKLFRVIKLLGKSHFSVIITLTAPICRQYMLTHFLLEVVITAISIGVLSCDRVVNLEPSRILNVAQFEMSEIDDNCWTINNWR